MSPLKSNDDIIVAEKAEKRQRQLKKAAEIAEAAKKKAIKDATENLGLCGLVLIALIITAVAFPLAGVIVLFA